MIMRSIKQISAYPLQWPDGWIRTKPNLRVPNYAWKKTFAVYRTELIHELRRLGAIDVVISTDIPINKTNGLPREGFNPPDPGVAVYFNRVVRPDYSWQDILQTGPMLNMNREQAIAHINKQFQQLSKTCHPDTARPDLALFHQLSTARKQATESVLGTAQDHHAYSLACDKFDAVRLNFHAIGLTIESLRQIDRCGATTMLERAFRGFQMALPARA